MTNSQEIRNTTEFFASNAEYIASIYEKYLQNPASVEPALQKYFQNLANIAGDADSSDNIHSDFFGGSWGKIKPVKYDEDDFFGKKLDKPQKQQRNVPSSAKTPANKGQAGQEGQAQTSVKQNPTGLGISDGISDEALNTMRAHMLIRAYRVRGHLQANLDPLGIRIKEKHQELDPARYGFSAEDYEKEIYLGGWLGRQKASLNEIIAILNRAYSGNFALDYIHITSLEKKEWLENRIESSLGEGKCALSKQQKKQILQQLVEVVGFEEFLHTKYPGAKRFSVEGGENLLPAMQFSVETSVASGVKEVVLGMPHRGRLSVLTNFMGKPYAAMLSEFEGNLANPDDVEASGDVKYHLGKSANKEFLGEDIHLSLTANPSHLEAVNPVVVGKVRAKQDQRGDGAVRNSVLGMLLHGDASFSGQGVVAETFVLSGLQGYHTGGTIHFVVNNQIGFTTPPEEGHVSPYPTEVAKMNQAPIFHVNGDDPEAVVFAAKLAAEFRAEFKEDVVVDIICYRKYGHNEGDEPMFTQPVMYHKIKNKQTPRDIYADKLITEGIISAEEYQAWKKSFNDFLQEEHAKSKIFKPEKADMLEGKWGGFERINTGEKPRTITGVEYAKLKAIAASLASNPAGIELNKKIVRLLAQRDKMQQEEQGFDWATAESLAFGSLLLEGYPVRLSGQDVLRGTFSQRHAALTDQKTNARYLPLNNLSNLSDRLGGGKPSSNTQGKQGKQDKQAAFEAINSPLSEFAVLGFEYGYSLSEPNALTLWEAQFGDFYNGAQVIIDQFISSADAKWLRMSGLVMLLPHGYEGQGPEHSSARLERFLQNSAEDNWQVANCTTPANYFHILRRQIHRKFRKPLILMTPKSLLRHKLAKSSLAEMADGTCFQEVIGETSQDMVADDAVKKIVICSGKLYYDIYEERQKRGIKDIVIIRLEQFYPFPFNKLTAEISRYKNAIVFWSQEEPKNQGGYSFVKPRIEDILRKKDFKHQNIGYNGRSEAASTAAGYMKIHTVEQQKLVNESLTIDPSAIGDNFEW